jgi:SpoIID/LytB domain protein
MRRRTVPGTVAALAVAAAGLLLPAVVPAPADAVRTKEVFTVPASREFTVTGNGFGHGNGMSQYGARGAAEQGLTARQILAFYYPGTALSTFTGSVTVLITSDTTRDVQVRAQRGLSVRDRGTGKVRALPVRKGVTKWRLNVVGNRAVVGYFRHGWHPYKLGGKRYLVGDGEFLSTSHLTLVTPKGDKVLRGSLRAASPTPGSTDRDTVNVVSLENYVRGVVPAEMPASWAPAAVQAQAIAARSYALFERAENSHRHYQLCDTTSCQVYGGVRSEQPASDKAVAATAGQYLTYHGVPAFTQFSASNGGWTSLGSFPYLPNQRDDFDKAVDPYLGWTKIVKASTLEKHYPALGALQTITITAREPGGTGGTGTRVESVQLTGADGSRVISGDDFRFLYGLRSTWFDLS